MKKKEKISEFMSLLGQQIVGDNPISMRAVRAAGLRELMLQLNYPLIEAQQTAQLFISKKGPLSGPLTLRHLVDFNIEPNDRGQALCDAWKICFAPVLLE